MLCTYLQREFITLAPCLLWCWQQSNFQAMSENIITKNILSARQPFFLTQPSSHRFCDVPIYSTLSQLIAPASSSQRLGSLPAQCRRVLGPCASRTPSSALDSNAPMLYLLSLSSLHMRGSLTCFGGTLLARTSAFLLLSFCFPSCPVLFPVSFPSLFLLFSLSPSLPGALDDMGSRLEELEASVNDLLKEASDGDGTTSTPSTAGGTGAGPGTAAATAASTGAGSGGGSGPGVKDEPAGDETSS